jgi:CelD/BcsL family acetyltransferase involved in cellulose biosynthesis
MVEASAGGTSFGYLYNFVMDGVVYNYQSGFLYESDGRYKPGLVTHALAIQHNVDGGNQTYDLLMGDQRFKRSLAMQEEDMLSLVVRRTRLRLRLEERLHDIWDWVRK